MKRDGIKFTVLCDDLGISLQAGLKLFTKNIYIDDRITHDIPFMGHNLHQHPYYFKANNRNPENLFVSRITADEIRFRFKNFQPNFQANILKRYGGSKVKKEDRKRLRLYKGAILLFDAVFQRMTYSNMEARCCVGELKIQGEEKIISNHTWIRMHKDTLNNRHFDRLEPFSFRGRVVPYSRFDNNTESFFDDVSIYVKELLT